MPQAAWSKLSEVENRTTEALKGFQTLVEDGLFFVETIEPATELAKLTYEPRIVVDDPRNSVGALAPWGVELGCFQ